MSARCAQSRAGKGINMQKILITGGSVFVSKFAAEWFAARDYEVYVLNRGRHEQPAGAKVICADRHALGNCLKKYSFDAVLDITAYDEEDIRDLLAGAGEIGDYIFISSSAVYPETLPQPFCEEEPVGENAVWGEYGRNKIKAEQFLLHNRPDAYILRPPYLYGPMQNLYRESFVFDCAMQGRAFYIPGDGRMPLQFFHVEDLCKVMEQILLTHPKEHIMNVGNSEIVDINQFVQICYEIVGQSLNTVHVKDHENWRDFFCFYNYGYVLNLEKQNRILPVQKDLRQGLLESFVWYKEHQENVAKREYIKFIDEHF